MSHIFLHHDLPEPSKLISIINAVQESAGLGLLLQQRVTCSRWGATGRTREQHPALAQQWSLSPLCKNALSARNGGLKLLLKTTAVLRMSKSKKKQTVQPAVAAAPSPSQLSPSREESEAPLQLSTLSFKRTRSSQVRSLPVQNHLLPFSSCLTPVRCFFAQFLRFSTSCGFC